MATTTAAATATNTAAAATSPTASTALHPGLKAVAAIPADTTAQGHTQPAATVAVAAQEHLHHHSLDRATPANESSAATDSATASTTTLDDDGPLPLPSPSPSPSPHTTSNHPLDNTVPPPPPSTSALEQTTALQLHNDGPTDAEQQTQHHQQLANGEAQPSETDSDDMASHRPTLPSPHPTAHHPLRPPAYSSSPLPPPTHAYHNSLPNPQIPYGSSYSTPPATTAPSDHHRPTLSTSSNNVTLPSMRTMEELSRQQSTPSPHSMNAPLAHAPPTTSYYSHQTMVTAPPPHYAGSQDALARYPLPHDPRMSGNRGPKKEIKRRTKTGCLTCRKRRIKCDETHPTCNNCKKSKRECLGYDPIFRQQPGVQPGAPLQHSATGSPTGSTILPASPVTRHINHLNSYGSQPAVIPSAYTSSPNLQPTSIHTPSPQLKPEPHYGYPPASQQQGRYYTATAYETPRSLDPKHLPPPHAISPAHPPSQNMKIDDIIALLGPAPPAQSIIQNEATFNEVTKVYHEMYASSLASFFETTWYYFAENGQMTFPRDGRLVEYMASFLKTLEAVKANDHVQMANSGVLETRLVWELARTVYQTPEKAPGAMRVSLPAEGDAAEARGRVRVVEALLSGEYLTNNPLSPPMADSDNQRARQFDFWYSLADFVRQRENPDSPQAVKAREEVINRMRLVLDGRENRDLLYSIAVARELAPSFGPTYGTTPQHIDEADPKSRLAVASKFIIDESHSPGGTTNVVRRFSDIASRAFVNPGVNVIRRA